MKKRMFIPMLFSVLSFGIGFAQQKTAWSLKDCIDYALTHSVKLQQNKASEQTAAIELKQAKAGLLPSLNASTSQNVTYRPFQDAGGNFVNGGIATRSVDKATQSGSYGIDASWTLWNGGRNRLNIQNSTLDMQKAALTTQTTANSLQEQIAQIYVQILYMQEALKVNQELLKQDSVVYARGEQMVREKQMSKADLAQLGAQVSSGRYNVINVKTQIEDYKTQLKQLLEISDEESIDIANIEVADEKVLSLIPSKSSIYASALENRPEIKSNQLAIEQSKLSTKIARSGYMPTISMNGGVGDSHMTGTQTSYWKQMKTNFNANVGVSVSIPIFDNRQNKSSVEKARVQEVTSQLDLLETQKQLYTSIENYWTNATNNQEKFLAAKDNVEALQTSYDLIQEQFRLGLKNISDLLTSRANLLSAKQSMLQDKYTTVLNRALLEFYANNNISI